MKKKKSLVGWTHKDWKKSFTKSHPNWKDRVFLTGIMNKSMPFLADTKVKITIEEV